MSEPTPGGGDKNPTPEDIGSLLDLPGMSMNSEDEIAFEVLG